MPSKSRTGVSAGTRMVTMRMLTTTLEAVDEAAVAMGVDRTEWVRRAVLEKLGMDPDVVEPPARWNQYLAKPGMVDPVRVALRAERYDGMPIQRCDHPADRRVGTFCAKCGRPVG